MRLILSDLSPLQQSVLQAARGCALRRARGGYSVSGNADVKPFARRTVFMLERQGLIELRRDGAEAAITNAGTKLLVCGTAEVDEP